MTASGAGAPVPRLAARDMWFSHGERAVLSGMSVRVEPGEVVGVLGPNGCGKTTLIRLITGSLRPDAGRIEVDGADLSALSPGERARLVAAVPQDPVAPAGFTVAELVMMGRNPHLGLLQAEGDEDRAAAASAMERAGLSEMAHRPVGRLSGGERQRVFFAMALCQRAPVLLLDEPTSNLDLAAQASVMSLAREACADRGGAVLLAMHDLTLAAQWCDRLVLIESGAARAAGPPAEVLTPGAVREVYGAEVVVAPHPRGGGPVVLHDGGRALARGRAPR